MHFEGKSDPTMANDATTTTKAATFGRNHLVRLRGMILAALNGKLVRIESDINNKSPIFLHKKGFYFFKTYANHAPFARLCLEHRVQQNCVLLLHIFGVPSRSWRDSFARIRCQPLFPQPPMTTSSSPSKTYMKTSLDGFKSSTRIKFDRLDAENPVRGYWMIVAWNPSGQKTLGSLFAHGGNYPQ